MWSEKMRAISLLLVFVILFTTVGYAAEVDAIDPEPEQSEDEILTDETIEDTEPDGDVEEPSEEDEDIFEEVKETGLMLTLKDATAYHESYISGAGNGYFYPDNKVTRAEAAQMLYNLLENTPEDRMEFTDVSQEDWYYDAVGLLAAAGILDFNGTRVGPKAFMSRGQFAAVVSRFYDDPEEPLTESPFTDVDEDTKYYEEILKATQLGLVNGIGDGTFCPEEAITRAQAVSVINRLTGRESSNNYTDTIVLPLYADVPASHWAYTAVMDASLSHTFERNSDGEAWTWVKTEPLKREPGLYFVDFDFYYIDEETGLPVTDTTIGTLYFGADGKYTSGDSEIDGYVKDTLQSLKDSGKLTDTMTQLEKLRVIYNYTRDSFTYLKRHYYELGDTGWELEEARTMFSTKRGNCYCFAGVFYYLSRQLGYDNEIISGQVGYKKSPHGWVEIEFDGIVYIFDTELEMAYRKKGVYYYDFFKMSYASVPWPYYK